MKLWDLKELCMHLNGPVSSTGNHDVDQVRLKNMIQLTDLVGELIDIIAEEAESAKSHEESVRDIGEHARGFLSDTQDFLTEKFYT